MRHLHREHRINVAILAQIFGVAVPTIHKVVTGQTYRNVAD